MQEDGETRFKLEDIVGEQDGIGVENLRGSGLIAGETSAAYEDTFTLSYVTGRSVGIGAYLNRLAQRVTPNHATHAMSTVRMESGSNSTSDQCQRGSVPKRVIYTP